MPHFSATNTSGEDVPSLTIVSEYREWTTTLEYHRHWAGQISNFSTLLYICICIVAIATGGEKNAIEADMKLFLEIKQGQCTASKDYLRRLRAGARWAIDCVKELGSAGLKHRAWELFVICMSAARLSQ